MNKLLTPPWRDYLLIGLLTAGFAVDFLVANPASNLLLAAIALVAVTPTIWESLKALGRGRMTIDVFNTVAIGVSFLTLEFRSAGFIALMLSFARVLEWHTESRTRRAIEELLKLKPLTATREVDGKVEDIDVNQVKVGDILLIKAGMRAPVDGVVAFGKSFINESSVTGESALVEKILGDEILSSSLVETGVLKMRATRVGKDSTIERMAELMREASSHKSRSEKLADRFAGAFLPFVALAGLATYFVTHDLTMTAALFLVACADDMSVAIPLAMTASLGMAAKRGVIIKGGEWLDRLAKMKALVLDKTGTLTFGSLSIQDVQLAKGVKEKEFWINVAVAEKFSEHPVGRMVFRAAAKRFDSVPDPDSYEVYAGSGVKAMKGKTEIILGSEVILKDSGLKLPDDMVGSDSAFHVFFDREYAGSITVADVPRPEAVASLRALKSLGVRRIEMFTGDNRETAASVAEALGISEYRHSMKPEQKMRGIEKMIKEEGVVGMVGDGINDAPALARADVGVAMGTGGTAVAVEAADVVILADDLSRLPEMVMLGRRTISVIRGDIVIWLISNAVGFALVVTGVAGPPLAAFYNFATDFLPLMNSTRLFKAVKSPARQRR